VHLCRKTRWRTSGATSGSAKKGKNALPSGKTAQNPDSGGKNGFPSGKKAKNPDGGV
jgi:hypothetical protein